MHTRSRHARKPPSLHENCTAKTMNTKARKTTLEGLQNLKTTRGGEYRIQNKKEKPQYLQGLRLTLTQWSLMVNLNHSDIPKERHNAPHCESFKLRHRLKQIERQFESSKEY